MRAAVLVPFLLLSSCIAVRVDGAEASFSTSDAFASCRRLLERQAKAWNRGDIAAFASGYHKSDDIVFASASGVHVGFDAMLARYKSKYPDRAAMGKLRFSRLSFQKLGRAAVTARGRWQLTREKDKPWGWFTLVFRHIEGEWKIVLDYTTSEG